VSKIQKVFQGFKTSFGSQFVKFGLLIDQALVLLNTPKQFITFETLFSLNIGLGFNSKKDKTKWFTKFNS
jgi:hypothetical protein